MRINLLDVRDCCRPLFAKNDLDLDKRHSF